MSGSCRPIKLIFQGRYNYPISMSVMKTGWIGPAGRQVARLPGLCHNLCPQLSLRWRLWVSRALSFQLPRFLPTGCFSEACGKPSFLKVPVCFSCMCRRGGGRGVGRKGSLELLVLKPALKFHQKSQGKGLCKTPRCSPLGGQFISDISLDLRNPEFSSLVELHS